jgi:hypothetical protein
MAREEFPLWSASGLLEPGPPTSFAAALSRISSQWLTPDLLSSPSGGKGAEQARDDRAPMPGRISCGTQTLPDLTSVVRDPAHGAQRDGGQASGEQDSPPSRPGWSPVTEERLRDMLRGGEEGRGLRGPSKEGSRRVSTGEEGREAYREWYQRMLLAIKLKQAKRVEDMEARFEEELRRRTEMHEAALHQMAAQATGEGGQRRGGAQRGRGGSNALSLTGLGTSELYKNLQHFNQTYSLAIPMVISRLCLAT